jgi:hypothetical protein
MPSKGINPVQHSEGRKAGKTAKKVKAGKKKAAKKPAPKK